MHQPEPLSPAAGLERAGVGKWVGCGRTFGQMGVLYFAAQCGILVDVGDELIHPRVLISGVLRTRPNVRQSEEERHSNTDSAHRGWSTAAPPWDSITLDALPMVHPLCVPPQSGRHRRRANQDLEIEVVTERNHHMVVYVEVGAGAEHVDESLAVVDHVAGCPRCAGGRIQVSGRWVGLAVAATHG